MLIYVTRGSVRPHLSSLSERLIAGLAYTDTRSYDTVSTRRFEPGPLNTTKGLKTTHRATTTTRIENPLKAFRPEHSMRLGRLSLT